MTQELSNILLDVYERMLQAYGPQHWWPGESPFEVIIGAILTQSASWTNVEKAINNLKASEALSIPGLQRLPSSDLAVLVYPSGYYNAKAAKIKAFVTWLSRNYEASLEKLFGLEADDLRRELLGVYGIGEETADSIVLYAAGKPVFVIDAYTRRIISRLGVAPGLDGYSSYQALFMSNLPRDADMFNEYHALLVRHGKDVCKKRPACEGCCLAALCATAKTV